MKTIIMAINVGNRKEAAPEVQELLTKYGCIIKTRLGLHAAGDNCSRKGLIILELSSEDIKEIEELEGSLKRIETVSSNKMQI